MKKPSTLYIFLASLVICTCLAKQAYSQVAISVGAQSFYDDNVFLENGKNQPSPIVFNEQLIDSFPSGFTTLKNFDGKKDSDLITNLFTQFSGTTPFFRDALDSDYNLRAGTILFNEFSEQNRFTLDGHLAIALSKNVLPEPFYLRLRNAIQSASNNLAVASGTVTQSTQNYIISTETGISGAQISRDLSYDLGYTGSYQKFLGAFYFNQDNSSTNTEQQGTDFHSHTGQTAVNYRVDKSLEVGVLGSGGVQLFTKIHEGAFQNSTQEPSDLDRTNGQLLGTTEYTLAKSLSFTGSGGLAYSKLINSPKPRTVTIINEDGQSEDVVISPKSSNTGLTYTGALNYAYRPGALFTLGATQGFTTNLDGQRFISRMVFANLVETLTTDLQATLGTRYVQFEDESGTRPDSGRIEGSASLNYHLTDSTSLNCGYNFSQQTADDSELSNIPAFATPDYTSNRIFVGITSGFVGLPF